MPTPVEIPSAEEMCAETEAAWGSVVLCMKRLGLTPHQQAILGRAINRYGEASRKTMHEIHALGSRGWIDP
jgi:hypothetical protein